MFYSSFCGVKVRVFKTKWMARFQRRQKVLDSDLLEAIIRAERGLMDADLGGGLIKQRVARKGQGKSGGYRMIVAYRVQNRAVFLYAFAKDELVALRIVGSNWMNADAGVIAKALEDGALQEVKNEE